MFNIPDHPEIQSIERTGYPSWLQGEWIGGESEEDDPEEDY